MSLEAQEPTHSNGGGDSCNDTHRVHIKMISVASSSWEQIKLCSLELQIGHDSFTDESFCKDLIKPCLVDLDIPQAYYNGHDCDMVVKLSRMFHDLMLQRHGCNHEDYICVFIIVYPTCCFYNVVNSSCYFHAEQIPSSELIQRMTCEGGETSLPAGASALLNVEPKEDDNCVICLQGFSSGDAFTLPCSHVYHYDCILEWFVQSSTCPLCRFSCSHTLLQ